MARQPGRGRVLGNGEAFGISQNSALAIISLITCAAFVAPVFLTTWAASASTQVPLALDTSPCCWASTWHGTLGASDVANAMGTSVGSGALTLRQVRANASLPACTPGVQAGSTRSVLTSSCQKARPQLSPLPPPSQPPSTGKRRLRVADVVQCPQRCLR